MAKRINRKQTLALFKEILDQYNFKESYITFERENAIYADNLNPNTTLGDIFSTCVDSDFSKRKELMGKCNERTRMVAIYTMALILSVPTTFILTLWAGDIGGAFKDLSNYEWVDISKSYYKEKGLIK